MSGKPQLNAGKSGVMLTEVKVEDVRLLGLPNLLGLGQGHLPTRKDTPLPDLPLFSFAPGQLKRADVAYGATGVEVTSACASTSSRAERHAQRDGRNVAGPVRCRLPA
ncbi:MAG: hypothetical protein U5L03_15135 [Burkholderiaceae bacterium]|nr:hypothetical protein [Burkholderiaceae bacterium]